MKCTRWSCQVAVVPDDTWCHTGGADESADFGGLLVGMRDRLRYVAGDRTVLEDAARTDPQVRLAVVAEHHDVVATGVAELQVVAEIDDA